VPDCIIETAGLTKVYRKRQIEVHALRGVSLQVRRGEISCIMGPSGSGKSTLMNVIGGLDRPTEGKVSVDGVNLNTLSESRLADFRLARVGYIFQFYNLFPTLTAFENVEFPLALAKLPDSERRSRVEGLLEMVGMSARARHRPDELSGGEQQRIAIARALANNPALVLADEPTGDLDSETARSFLDLVKRLNSERKQTFLIVTHDPLVSGECGVVFNMRDGLLSSPK
jgi:putative ABC transport system ATP-binding protein